MKNKIKFLATFTLLIIGAANAQTGIGTTSPDTSSVLDVTSTTKGMLIPRLTTVQRTAIASPAAGLQVYDTTTNTNWFFNGTVWVQSASGTSVGTVTNVTGTAPISIATGTTTPSISLNDSGVTAGTYTSVTVNSKGLVTNATSPLATVSNIVSAGNLSTTVNGVTGNPVAIPNMLTSTANTLSSTVANGTTQTASIINSIVNTVSGNTVLTTVNGVNGTAVTLPNLYTIDGTLTAARTITQGNNNLTFSSTTGNFIFNPSSTGKIGVGTTSPDASSVLDVTSTTRGMLIPRLTTAQRTAIASPAAGLQVYDTTTNTNWFFNGTVWMNLVSDLRNVGSGNHITSDAGVGSNGTNIGTGTGGNVAIGLSAMSSNTTGYYNVAIGYDVLLNNTTGVQNTAIGIGSMKANTTGNNGTAFGGYSLTNNTTGSGNVAMGWTTLSSNTTGGNNTAVGNNALTTNTIGTDNTALGANALIFNTTGGSNIAIGSSALYKNTSGISNVAISNALFNNTTGNQNLGIGAGALNSNTTGNLNIAFGINSGSAITSGSSNILLGASTANGITVGNNNIVIGNSNPSGLGIITGSNNTIIGSPTGLSSSLSNNIILADGAGNQRININATGNVGIGTSAPDVSAALEVNSTIKGLLVPKMTTIQRDAIVTPASGLQIFNTTTNAIELNIGTPVAPNWGSFMTNTSLNGKGTIAFGDIFPNTAITIPYSSGNIQSIASVTTTLGVVKAAKITFNTAMPNTNYSINITGGTTNTDNAESVFSTIGGVVYYFTNKTITSFIVVAQELYPDTQQSALFFSFGY